MLSDLRSSVPFFTVAAAAMIIMPACAGQLIDYDGHPRVTNPAPVLKFQRKTEPAPTGIDYEFAELV